MISDQELDEIRAEQEKYMPSRVTIKRRTFLGPPDAWDYPVIAQHVPARITPGLFGQLRQVAQKLASIQAYTITLHWDQVIRDSDQIVDEANSAVYEVRFARINSSYQTATQVVAELIV